jgi:hypothetical protein
MEASSVLNRCFLIRLSRYPAIGAELAKNLFQLSSHLVKNIGCNCSNDYNTSHLFAQFFTSGKETKGKSEHLPDEKTSD